MTAFWLIVILAILAVAAIWIYNGLIVLKNRVAEAWSDIEVQLKRRYDLIPNLVSTVKGYATHERELFEKVTEARNRAISATTIKEKAQAENVLSSTLKSLFAVAENYPELKANQNFLHLQQELVDAEDKIMSARRFYNSQVRDFNIRQEIFPASLIARLFSFRKAELFELPAEEEAEKPEVNFSA